MKYLILILALAACAPQKDVSNQASATPKPNAVRQPSLELCNEIAANLTGTWTIQTYEHERVFVIAGSPLIESQDFGLYPYNNGHIQIGTFCTLEVTNGSLTGVL